MSIPDYRLDPPESNQKEVTCSRCGDVVDERDPVFEFGGEHLCYDCFLRKVFQEGVTNYVPYEPGFAREMAEILGVEYERAEDYAS